MTRLGIALISLAAALSLVACRTIGNQHWKTVAAEDPNTRTGDIKVLQISEPKDKHEPMAYFDKADPDNVIRWLHEGDKSPIILFVHGWHHNACDKVDPGDPDCATTKEGADAYGCDPHEADKNLCRFRGFIARLNTAICALYDVYAGGQKCIRAKGIYIAWRGDSMDFEHLPDELDFPTILGRRNASSRVGAEVLSDFISRVQREFGDRYFVFSGHSLGGNAIYHAFAALPNSTQGSGQFILLNPAISSRDVADLETRIKSNLRDRRVITVVQAAGDVPVHFIFPLVAGKSIGFDDRRVNFSAAVAPGATPGCTNPSLVTTRQDDCKYAFSSGLVITALPKGTNAACSSIFESKVWVIKAAKEVSANHNDMLNNVESCALAELVSKRAFCASAAGRGLDVCRSVL